MSSIHFSHERVFPLYVTKLTTTASTIPSAFRPNSKHGAMARRRRGRTTNISMSCSALVFQLLPGAILLIVVLYINVHVQVLKKEAPGSADPSVASQRSHRQQLATKRISNSKQLTTMAPQSSDPNLAGFVHIGKTGGSSISKLLRNGCSSFASVRGCGHTIHNETIVSRLVERYYHVSDFWRLPTANHRRFLVSTRDVYDRFVSALLYMHPDNLKFYHVEGLTQKQQHFAPLAYACFPSLEEFATLLRRRPDSSRTPDDCNYPYPPKMVEVGDCSALACATLHGKVRFFSHLFFNYRNILDTKLPLQQEHNEQGSTISRKLYVIRQEHLWDDWINVNILWGQPVDEPIVIPTKGDTINQRNVSSMKLPVSRSISKQGRDSLCQALELEYDAYFRLLVLAVNMGPNDIDDCKRIAEHNCPNLDIKMILEKAKTEGFNIHWG